ncbi:DUF2442 domain-containing protein [Sporomusa malonica]|uniref:DUF2442 domain-containing protein n=1 Tax=Sporomusa malonica TaxID=112901 RepID=A0A1W2E5V0_9FIRM|nr:DUF2442 domain-containing protein [Sporomusa malonica]SMD04428.1 Protein of unknown function [Sporomusa malonica]
MGKITEVILGDDYLVTVRFDNNHSVTINMKKKLHTARFSELRDKQVFNAAKTDGKSVHWPGGISIAISEIMEIVIK